MITSALFRNSLSQPKIVVVKSKPCTSRFVCKRPFTEVPVNEGKKSNTPSNTEKGSERHGGRHRGRSERDEFCDLDDRFNGGRWGFGPFSGTFLGPRGFFDGLKEVQTTVDKMMQNAENPETWQGGFGGLQLRTFTPHTDISETDTATVINLELPGLKKEDVKIQVDDGVLEISGTKQFEQTWKDKERKYRKIERSYGSFTRRFSVPVELDVSSIKAKFDNGVLHLEIPKLEKSTPKSVNIE